METCRAVASPPSSAISPGGIPRCRRPCALRWSAAMGRVRRSAAEHSRALHALADAAAGTDNVLPPIIGAVKALATVGEIADVMRQRFGEYHPSK